MQCVSSSNKAHSCLSGCFYAACEHSTESIQGPTCGTTSNTLSVQLRPPFVFVIVCVRTSKDALSSWSAHNTQMAGDFSNVYLALCTKCRSSGVLLLVLLESGLTGVYASRYTIDEYVGVLLMCGDSECDVCVAHINHVRVGNALCCSCAMPGPCLWYA